MLFLMLKNAMDYLIYVNKLLQVTEFIDRTKMKNWPS